MLKLVVIQIVITTLTNRFFFFSPIHCDVLGYKLKYSWSDLSVLSASDILRYIFCPRPPPAGQYVIEIWKHWAERNQKTSKLTNPFSCLWTFAETGGNCASSSNLKWTSRSWHSPTTASLVSRWPRLLYFYFIALCFCIYMKFPTCCRWGTAPSADDSLPCHRSWRPGQH